MTIQEAINWIRFEIAMTKFNPSTGEDAYLNEDARATIEALEMAIDALNRLQSMGGQNNENN